MGHKTGNEPVRASVWLRPTGQVLNDIEHRIDDLHRQWGGIAPTPHVTLLSGIECTLHDAQHRLKLLAARLQPFTVQLGKADWRSREYFRCVFAVAESSRELLDAQRAAHDAFEMNPAGRFEPHLSLLYGDLNDARRRRIVEATGSVDLSFRIERVHLFNAASGVPVAEWISLGEASISSTPT